MSVKEQMLAALRALPDNATWDDIGEQVRLLAALQQAEEEIARGEGVPQEAAETRIHACLQKLSGRQVA